MIRTWLLLNEKRWLRLFLSFAERRNDAGKRIWQMPQELNCLSRLIQDRILLLLWSQFIVSGQELYSFEEW